MKRVLVVMLLVAGAAFAGVVHRAATRPSPGEQRDEIRQTYRLAPGARVEIAGINGSVSLETADTDTVEVDIIRTASSKDDLERSAVAIEQTPAGLTLRGTRNHGFFWHFWGGNVKQQVLLKAPRQIALGVKGINGKVVVGRVEGGTQISGVNGKVEVADAAADTEISGVNGAVSLSIDRQLGERGLRISGVNGAVELRLPGGLDADVQAHGMNGSVRSEMPGVEVHREGHSNFSARLGAGGVPVTVSGINGGVRLLPAQDRQQ